MNPFLMALPVHSRRPDTHHPQRTDEPCFKAISAQGHCQKFLDRLSALEGLTLPSRPPAFGSALVTALLRLRKCIDSSGFRSIPETPQAATCCERLNAAARALHEVPASSNSRPRTRSGTLAANIKMETDRSLSLAPPAAVVVPEMSVNQHPHWPGR